MFQIVGAPINLTHRTPNPAGWNPVSLTKNFFTSRNLNRLEAGPTSAFRDMLARASLDTIALFPLPLLVNFSMKKTRTVTHNNNTIEQQRWFAMQGCTSCLAAGIWKLCTFHTLSRDYLQSNSPFDIVELQPGERSCLDNVYGGLEYQLMHHTLARMSLVNITD